MRPHRVAVIHPDLGVGGAERLIVDACKALQDCGHKVKIYTGYHNPRRCFEETRDGTITTITIGQWIPRTLFGKCHAIMAYLKMIYIAFYLIIFSDHDLILCDQISACIPILKLDIRNKFKIIFYCHFPDQLLTQRKTFLKLIYRKPIDLFEEWSTSLADVILVNSKFTHDVVKQTFKSLVERELNVLYPCVDVAAFERCTPSSIDCDILIERYENLTNDKFIFLSLNRFERKKCLDRAIRALDGCLCKLNDDNDVEFDKENKKLSGMHLIIAGGYDSRLQESVEYRAELLELIDELELNEHVTLIESPSDEDKMRLLKLCDAVVYTPRDEHFGIVPLEAMAMSKPVIASASGGPLETISEGINGLLCSESEHESFMNAMLKLYACQSLSTRMGQMGFKMVKEKFSYEAFRDNLNEACFPLAS